MNTDVLIAGGGIGGAVLAALLARGGKQVVIIERSVGPPPFLRPEILWPAAAETLFALRERSFWEQGCLRPLRGLMLRHAGKWQEMLTPETFHRAGVQPFLTQPNQTRETLLAICGATVRRGAEVMEVLRKDGRVTGVLARDVKSGETITFEAALTVGDDGTHSAVRAACGIGIELRPFPVEFLVRGLPVPSGWPEDVVRIWLAPRDDRSGLLGFGIAPLPGGEVACIAPVISAQAGETDALERAMIEFFARVGSPPAEPEALGFPRSFTRIHREWGHAARYGAPGAVLLGDALHPVSPAGGQGANMAIADAVVLARLILAGERDPVPAYEAARRRANERGIRPTRLAAQIFEFGQIPFIGALPGILLPRLLARPSIAAALLRSVARGHTNA